MNSQRIRIPKLRQLIGDASPEDFRRLGSSLSTRRLSPEDLGASMAVRRPDLVPIVSLSATCPQPRMTRCKVLSGRVRKE